MKKLLVVLVIAAALAASFASAAVAGDYLFGQVSGGPGGGGANVTIVNRDNGYTWTRTADGGGYWNFLTNFHPVYGWWFQASKRDGACYNWTSDAQVWAGGATTVGPVKLVLTYRQYIC